MNKRINIRIDEEALEILEQLKKELKITKSDIIRLSIAHFRNYVRKVSK